MLTKALIAFVPVAVLLVYSIAAFRKCKRTPALFQLLGAACLLFVVLTHVAEALHVLPMMGWGEPHSVGHYIDLSSAVGGGVFFAAGVLFRIRAKIA